MRSAHSAALSYIALGSSPSDSVNHPDKSALCQRPITLTPLGPGAPVLRNFAMTSAIFPERTDHVDMNFIGTPYG